MQHISATTWEIMKYVIFPLNDAFLEFALKDMGVATRLPGSVYTRQTRNQFLSAPGFYWKPSLFLSTARHLEAACADRMVSLQYTQGI